MDWLFLAMLVINLLLLPNLETAKVMTILYSIVGTGFAPSATIGLHKEVTHDVLSLVASGLFFSAAYDIVHAARGARGKRYVFWTVSNYLLGILAVGGVLKHL